MPKAGVCLRAGCGKSARPVRRGVGLRARSWRTPPTLPVKKVFLDEDLGVAFALAIYRGFAFSMSDDFREPHGFSVGFRRILCGICAGRLCLAAFPGKNGCPTWI